MQELVENLKRIREFFTSGKTRDRLFDAALLDYMETHHSPARPFTREEMFDAHGNLKLTPEQIKVLEEWEAMRLSASIGKLDLSDEESEKFGNFQQQVPPMIAACDVAWRLLTKNPQLELPHSANRNALIDACEALRRTTSTFLYRANYASLFEREIELLELHTQEEPAPSVAATTPQSSTVPMTTANVSSQPAPQGNSFRRESSKRWVVAFEGVSAAMPHMDGFFYIAKLLQNPRKELSVTDLFKKLHDIETSQLASQSRQDVIDNAALKEYRERLLAIEQELEAANRNNDEPAQNRLRIEKSDLEAQVKSIAPLFGKLRAMKSDKQEIGHAVAQAISRALNKIKKELPKLGEHLTAHIPQPTAFNPEYLPPPHFPEWHIKL